MGSPHIAAQSVIVITLDSSIISYLGVLFHVVQSLIESQQNRSKRITKLYKTMRKHIENILKLIAFIGAVINVSQGKIFFQAELEFHVKQPTSFHVNYRNHSK